MKSKEHQEIRELLPWYANNTLSDEKKELVEEHLKECEDCRKELEEIKVIASAVEEHGGLIFADHIESEKLSLFIESPEKLSPEERKEIREHLDACSDCMEDFEQIKEMLQPKVINFTERLNRIFNKIVPAAIQKPLPIAASILIIFILLYPAFFGIRHMMQKDRPLMLTQGTLTVDPEFDWLRWRSTGDEGEETVIEFSKDAQVILFTFDLPDIERENVVFNTAIHIADKRKKLVWEQKDFKCADIEGKCTFLLQRDILSAGSYVFLLHMIDQDTVGEIKTFHYPFVLTEQK